jgi:integrase
MAQRKQIVPGSVFVRNGSKHLYIKYQGKHISTGLDDTPSSRKIADEMLRQLHFDFINYNQTPVIRTKKIHEAFKIYLEDHCKELARTTKRLTELAFKSISPNDYYITDERINADVVQFTKSYKSKVRLSTITIYLQHYSVFANYCLQNGWIERYPEKIRSERKSSRRGEIPKQVIVFETEEFEKLTEYFLKKDKEFSLLLMFLWHTGGRISETLKLTWSQINFKTRRIRFANKINSGEDDYIPISSAVENILSQVRALNQNDKVFRWAASTYSRLIRNLDKAMLILGIDKQDRGFHAIRRTFATNLIDSNVSLADVKDLMRHRDIKTTIVHYKAKNAQRLEAVLEQAIVQSKTSPKLHP